MLVSKAPQPGGPALPGGRMRRREFIVSMAGAIIAWPLAARAQRPMPVVGYLSGATPAGAAHLLAAFKRGLAETGFVEGRNLHVEYRWAEGQYDRAPDFAADLVRRRVTLIAATGGISVIAAAKRATSTIPIVFSGGTDPVQLGIVASLNRPGGNATGITNLTGPLEAKRLEILRELVPGPGLIGYLWNPGNTEFQINLENVQATARAMGQEIEVIGASTEREIEAALSAFGQRRVRALLVATDPFFLTQRRRFAELAMRHGLPASFGARAFVEAGGLMSYGADVEDQHRQIGVYAGRILKGEKPDDLPVMQPTKFELVINQKTAKALGLTVPPTLIARADEVIE